MFKRGSIHGILVSGSTPDEAQHEWTQITNVLSRSSQRPVIDRSFPLTDYAGAFARLAEHPFGKVVVEIAKQ
jgi:NADPH:quinone reductase-like Zn-dependent oxidoreductase